MGKIKHWISLHRHSLGVSTDPDMVDDRENISFSPNAAVVPRRRWVSQHLDDYDLLAT